MTNNVRYVECPRDAWQGLPGVIPTGEKVRFLGALLEAGFSALDMGSFVSPRAVPQLADTEGVLAALLESAETADLLCIIANARGLTRAVAAGATHVGYPLSVNETFQVRNTGRDLAASWALVEHLHAETATRSMTLTVYLSMSFGNPYGDPWTSEDTAAAVARLRAVGVRNVALADTVGTATPERVEAVLRAVPSPETLGLHLHARPDAWRAPLEAALAHGLRWFEGALAGVGGCPFAGDDLVGNLPTEQVVPFLEAQGLRTGIQQDRLGDLAERAATLSARYSAAQSSNQVAERT